MLNAVNCMIELGSEKCIGCAGCVSVCPQNCIRLTENDDGFMYPSVDMEKCVHCNLCESVCIINHSIPDSGNKQAYAGFSNDSIRRSDSSSGAIFYELSKTVLNNEGVVFGAAFDDSWAVYHDFCTDLSDLKRLQTSKYVQSNLDGVFEKVSVFLNNGKEVLFCGTPCQCNALRLFLKKDYENLLLVDFICHGVPSPGVWNNYIKTFGSNIKKITFRDKAEGWKNYSFCVKTDSNIKESFWSNSYMKLFLGNYILRPSCYECKSRFPNKYADITLGDLWGADKLAPELDDDKGLSLIVINSDKGNAFFEGIKENIVYKEIDCEKAFVLNSPALYDVNKPSKREKVIAACLKENADFDKIVKKYTEDSLPVKYSKKIIKKAISVFKH